MRRLALIVLGLPAAAFVLWAALAATHWFARTTEAQRKAQAILAAPPADASGRHDAFAAVWLARYDIPDAEREAIARDDVARFAALPLERHVDFESAAAGRYHRLEADPETHYALCTGKGEACLANTRRFADVARKALDRDAALLANAIALQGYDHYRERFPTTLVSPTAPVAILGALASTDAALRFVDGDTAEGLRRACAAAASDRRLALHDDNRVVQAWFATRYLADGRLAADMLAEMPREAPLPPVCGEAFAPMPDVERASCDAMKIRFGETKSLLRPSGGIGDRLLFNERATVDALAPGFASFCTGDADVQREAERARPEPGERVPSGGRRRDGEGHFIWRICGVAGIAFNNSGCTLAELANPWAMNAPFAERLRDMQGVAALLAVAIAMRASAADQPASLPAGVSFDAAARMLRTPRRFHAGAESADLVVPAPASRLR